MTGALKYYDRQGKVLWRGEGEDHLVTDEMLQLAKRFAMTGDPCRTLGGPTDLVPPP